MYSHATFALQIATLPHIVVARKDVDLNASVAQFGKFAEQSHVSRRNDLAPLIPEIENIPQQIDRLRLCSYAFEPTHQQLLAVARRLRVAVSKVHIRGEIVHRLRV